MYLPASKIQHQDRLCPCLEAWKLEYKALCKPPVFFSLHPLYQSPLHEKTRRWIPVFGVEKCALED